MLAKSSLSSAVCTFLRGLSGPVPCKVAGVLTVVAVGFESLSFFGAPLEDGAGAADGSEFFLSAGCKLFSVVGYDKAAVVSTSRILKNILFNFGGFRKRGEKRGDYRVRVFA
jgi:hypothetical protein